MTNKIRRIDFRLTLEGQGIVNFDDAKTQKKGFWKDKKIKESVKHLDPEHNNVQLGKKLFTEDGGYKSIISSSCLRHAIFGDDIHTQSPMLNRNQTLRTVFTANTSSIIRGYLITDDTDADGTTKKKGTLTIGDAIQMGNTMSSLAVGTKSGAKTNTSLFFKETIGKEKYLAEGKVPLEYLQLFSLDQLFDRQALNEDYFELFSETLKKQIPEFNSKPGYFIRKNREGHNCAIEIPERGFVFSNEVMNILIKKLLTNMLEINIIRANAFAKTCSLQIKFIDENGVILNQPEEGWIDIYSKKDIDNLNMDFFNYYEEQDEETSKITRAELEKLDTEKKATADQKAKDEKNARAEASKKRKEEKQAKQTEEK